MHSLRPCLAFLCCALAACAPSVGSRCDVELAKRVYYNQSTGDPAYSGQALMMEYCVSCHSDSSSGRQSVRRGAPSGLDFDVTPSFSGPADRAQATADARRLAAAIATVDAHRERIYQQTLGGSMPPRNYDQAVSSWRTAAGEPLPGIREGAAHGLLRNWLACRTPVVERSQVVSDTCVSDDDCEITQRCEDGQCDTVGDTVPDLGLFDCAEPAPTFEWIYACVLRRSCVRAGCHSPSSTNIMAMSDLATTYANLTTLSPLTGSQCEGRGPYVVPGDASASLLIHKLETLDQNDQPVCGRGMPGSGQSLPPATIEIIRRWIDEGALLGAAPPPGPGPDAGGLLDGGM